ncbi:bifunctional adenosylcobinamide kinase/adenosylcobinamide-phosphate guanylyltransferase [Halalkalibacter oceani]|uniref:Bifunctional adenosylcobinamide kinase/adenosylcobinamide-phosphate guanylyltransferase n=1 Tax=Halalkalibacter oceani TaxID=1653776 RepID=A0A9X2IM97_9BACI|nr:bifunctional adenosylcobinamide kinase/adenosylcobinamide-phosphate guanylyltransferase [Halalkalibacter oceani]MCM3713659.1 bifunctional adenosylcobinamide kinase/adenosylcobinamide-phosphate guanylyltransferase [Halalkalibacter oceani]
MKHASGAGPAEIQWYNGYERCPHPSRNQTGTVIIFGLEAIVRAFLTEGEAEARERFHLWLESWLCWEQSGGLLYLIGSDVGKGVVPLEKEARLFRDHVGVCFQEVARKAKRVDLIWYGLATQLK